MNVFLCSCIHVIIKFVQCDVNLPATRRLSFRCNINILTSQSCFIDRLISIGTVWRFECCGPMFFICCSDGPFSSKRTLIFKVFYDLEMLLMKWFKNLLQWKFTRTVGKNKKVWFINLHTSLWKQKIEMTVFRWFQVTLGCCFFCLFFNTAFPQLLELDVLKAYNNF